MSFWRKKPVVIEAVRWVYGDEPEKGFVGNDGAAKFLGADFIYFSAGTLMIRTLEGPLAAQFGDWLIRGVKGEHYSCKPDIFVMTYEPVSPGVPTPEPVPAFDPAVPI